MTGGVVVVLGAVGRNFAAGMSGGTAFVFDPSADVPRALQPRDGRARAARRRERPVARPRPDRGSRAAHRQPARQAAARQLGAPGRALRQGDADRVQARARRRRARRGAPAAPLAELARRRREPADGQADRLHRVAARWRRTAAPIAERAARLARGRACRRARRDATATGRPLHGLRRAVLHQGCPLGNPIPDFAHAVLAAIAGSDAHAQLAATNDFPEFTGRLCPAPCEAACVLAIDNAPVTIESLERAIAERFRP